MKQSPRFAQPARSIFRTIRKLLLYLLVIGGTALLMRGSSVSADYQQRAAYIMLTSGNTFSLIRWEVGALARKLEALFGQPASTIAAEAQTDAVLAYLSRSQQIAQIEGTLQALMSEAQQADPATIEQAEAELRELRRQQDATRDAVEQIIQRQVSAELKRAGFHWLQFTWPPVQFTFTEPPQKLVVSPRHRIATHYYRMLVPEYPISEAEIAESRFLEEQDLSAYVTRIGGLGAFPTMVIDRARPAWVLSTVAHEWAHNYLTLFPLGMRYNASPQMTIINETVAEIVGEEIGARTLAAYYPQLLEPPPQDEREAEVRIAPEDRGEPSEPRGFDFRREMRATRLQVDRLLAAGKVDEAERYMEERRLHFVANGYPLRVLNQAYFAFHGSYGTSAASSDPLAPLLFDLRARAPDLRTFLRQVRAVTSVAELEALAEGPF